MTRPRVERLEGTDEEALRFVLSFFIGAVVIVLVHSAIGDELATGAIALLVWFGVVLPFLYRGSWPHGVSVRTCYQRTIAGVAAFTALRMILE